MKEYNEPNDRRGCESWGKFSEEKDKVTGQNERNTMRNEALGMNLTSQGPFSRNI